MSNDYYTMNTPRPHITLSDIMHLMMDYWKRAEPLPTFKTYKTREQRAITEITNTLDIILTNKEELTDKERAMFKEFLPMVTSSFMGVIMDKMNAEA